MYEQLSKELKASLFQRIKSPFFGSFFISFIFINYRFVFLMLSDKSIDTKFQMIDEGKLFSHIEPLPIYKSLIIDSIYLSTLLYPFIFALIYIAIVPLFEYYISMPIWKTHQNRLKKRYAELEQQEVFLGEEKTKYLNEIIKLKKEKEKLIEDITNSDVVNEQKIDKIKKQLSDEYNIKIEQIETDNELVIKDLKIKNQEDIKNINSELIKVNETNSNNKLEYQKEKEKYQSQIKQLEIENENLNLEINNFSLSVDDKNKLNNNLLTENESLIIKLENRNKSIRSLQQKIKEKNKQLQIYISKEQDEIKFKDKKYTSYLEKYSEDEMEFIKILSQSNIQDEIHYNEFITKLTERSNFGRIAAEHIFSSLEKKGLFYINDLKRTIFTPKLKELIYDLFKEAKVQNSPSSIW